MEEAAVTPQSRVSEKITHYCEKSLLELEFGAFFFTAKCVHLARPLDQS
jgi:hypothetical protein